MRNSHLIEPVLAFLQHAEDSFLADLRTLVAMDSGSQHKPGVDAVQDWLQARLATLGFTVERERQPVLGDNLLAVRPAHSPGSGRTVMLLGHADTVFPVGTAAARPLSQHGDRIMGPGTCDMKAGLLTGLYAIAALDHAGFRAPGKVNFLVVSDEEIHDRGSLPLIRSTARASDVAFTLEAARANGDIVTARKTAVWCTVCVRGKAAHAGVEPEKGRSANLALIRHLEAIHGLNGLRPGITVNIGRMEGGVQPNVVADQAWASLDLRGWRNDDIPLLLDAIRSQLAQPTVPDTTAWLEVTLDTAMPAMERTPAVEQLEAQAQEIAAALGFTVKGASTGGASDASFVAAEGVPVIDGMGPIGGLDHGPDEYIERSSIVPRAALLALMIAEAGER